METARHITGFVLLAQLIVGALASLTTGDGRPLAAAVLVLLLLGFVLIFTNDTGERDG